MKVSYALLALALSLTACDIFDPYEQPATPTPEAWSEQTMPQAQPAWPEVDWWKNFNAPELTALIEEAQKNNNDLGAAVARVHQADAQVSISGAPLLPSLDLSAGATRDIAPHKSSNASSNASTTLPNGSFTTNRTGSNYNAGLNASYELDFWGKNRSGLQSAEALRDASAFDRETVNLTVTSSVANVYFDMLATRERLAVAKDNLTAAQQLLDALNRRFAQGVVSRLDVAQQESVVAQQTATVPPLELQLSQDRDALAILLGRLPESVDAPQVKLAAVAVPVVPVGLPSELLQRRPDVQFAESNLISAHANINAARAAFFPDITLTAASGYQSNALDSLFKPGGLLLSFGGDLVQPIFEGGLLTGQLELSKGREEELAQDYHKAIISAFSDVEDSLAGVRRSAEEEQAQAAAERTAREAFTLTQQQFSGGTIDITTVLNTQRTLFAASDAYLQAKLSHLQAMVGLYRALGGGWKK
jgi:multidrug efflux system outer membrane protein